MKEKFKQLLLSTGREGMEKAVENLDKLGFFQAPASTRFHLSEPEGLVRHSLSVCETALIRRKAYIEQDPSLEAKLPEASVIIAALLHDVCKAEIYVQDTKNVKDKVTGQWHSVPIYTAKYDYFPMGHGEKSVIRLLLWGIKLTKDEMIAIRWHMGPWEGTQNGEAMGNLSAAMDQCPLLNLLMESDSSSCRLFESRGEQA